MFFLKSFAIALALVMGMSALAEAKSRHHHARHTSVHRAPVYGAYHGGYPVYGAFRSYNGYYANSYRTPNFQDTIRPY